LAHFDADGFLFLDGRSKDMIIRGGVNIYPHEIEEVLMRHAEVREAAATAMTSAELGEEVVAFVVLHRPLEQQQLLEHCRLQLAPYKVPKLIVQVDELPRNSSGKVLKAKLQELLVRQP
jgi:acyl-CoA synthetase (AMP-forming)/AMP-acid ligase II